MKKKLISIMLCAAMTVTMLMGCSSSDTTSGGSSEVDGKVTSETTSEEVADISLDGSWPEKSILIGVECFDTTDEQFLEIKEYFEYLTKYYNISFMYSESIASAEDELDFISSCAAAGAKALLGFYNISGVEAAQQAIDQGMYYWAADEVIYESLAENEMYLGTYEFAGTEGGENGDYLAGYEMGYSLAASGVSHILYCNGGASFGVQMFIDRQSGFVDGVAAAQKEGAEAEFDPDSDVIEGWPGTDNYTAAQSAALASDYDGIGVSFNAATWFQPIADAGKSESIKLAAIGEVEDTYYESVNSGQMISLVYDCEEVVFGNIIVTIINANTGNEDITRTEDGMAASVAVSRWAITTADEYNAIYEYHDEGNYFISAEDMAQCFPAFNSDATYETVIDLYSSFTLEYALSVIE